MSESLTASYWEGLYKADDKPWDLGQVSPPLKHYFDQLSDKDLFILIPGAGNAYEAEYLVNNGFSNVFICDYAQKPLDDLLKRCPAIKVSHLLKEDFFKLNNRTFDLVIEQTFFCAIDKSLRKEYFKQVHSLLKPNGRLVGLLFDCEFKENRPPFGGSKNEYEEYFNDLFKTAVYDIAYNSVKPRAGRELFINLMKA